MSPFSVVLRSSCAAAILCAPIPAQEPAPADPQQLAIWGDPGWRRRLAESYLGETEIEPRLDDDERDDLRAVFELIAAGRKDAAGSRLDALRAPPQHNAAYDFTRATLHFEQDQLAEAAAGYLAAIAAWPRFRRAWRNLGTIHVRRGEHAKAATALARVVELGGGDGTTFGLLGFATLATGDPVAAESAYRMAVMLDPRSIDWRLGLARSLFQQRRFADAAALLQPLLETWPERADLWLLQANAFAGLDQPLRAAENLEIVDRLGQSTAESLALLGDIYVNGDLADLAVGAYERGLPLSPPLRSERALRAARALAGRGEPAAAQRLLAAVERHRGGELTAAEQKDVKKLRARLLSAAGAGAEEAQILGEVVASDPLDGEALLLLGQYHQRAGDVEQAVFWYERAAALVAHEADAKLLHARLLVGQRRYGEALPLLRRAQALQPRDNLQQFLDQVERAAAGR